MTESATARKHLGWALTLICTAQLMVILDATITNIALPYIQRDLDFATSALSWIITSYSLALAGFLLLGGRVGDLFGRRRAFMFGLLLFAAASLVGGFAQNEAMLLTSRAVQGLGAAFASPNALALITTTFEPGPRRSRAFAVYGMMSGVGAAIGLVLGGWLTGLNPEWFGTTVEGWRFTFFINVPIGLAAALAAPLLLDESDKHAGELDIPGAITATFGLLALVFGITRAGDQNHGWTDGVTLGALSAGVGLLALFVLVESRVEHPLLPFRILKNRDRVAAYLTMMLAAAAMFASFFFLTLLLQNVMGVSPIDTGLKFLPWSITMIIAAMVVSRLIQKVDPGKISGVGGVIAAIGLLGLSRLPYDADLGTMSADINYWTDIFPWVVITPIGMGCIFIPTTMSVVHRVAPADTGIASGILNTMQHVGGALGLATLSTIALHFSTDLGAQIARKAVASGVPLDQELARSVTFIHGGTRGFLVGAVVLFGAGMIAWFLNRIQHDELAKAHTPGASH
jgi:EmrB/QacA subfamily drug resistance transporter